MKQHNPPHPGAILAGLWLEPLSLTITATAAALGISRKHVSELVNGRAAISVDVALRLERAFGKSAESWLAHQTSFDLWQLRKPANAAKYKTIAPVATAARETASRQ